MNTALIGRFRRLARHVIGWTALALGLFGCIFPVLPGIPFLILGVALIGPRHPVLRRLLLNLRIRLRKWTRASGLRRKIGLSGKRVIHAVLSRLPKLAD